MDGLAVECLHIFKHCFVELRSHGLDGGSEGGANAVADHHLHWVSLVFRQEGRDYSPGEVGWIDHLEKSTNLKRTRIEIDSGH